MLIALMCTNMTLGQPEKERQACISASTAASIQLGVNEESKKLERFAAKEAKEHIAEGILIGLGIAYTYNRTGQVVYSFRANPLADLIRVEAGEEGQVNFIWAF